MWHRLLWCATRTSAVHVLRLPMVVSAHGDNAPARTRLAREARVPTRSTWHSGQEWGEASPARPPPACVRHGLPRERRYGIPR